MALIRVVKHKEIDRPSLHKQVEASYSIIENGGRKVLQIDSYGSKDRELPGKISQSMQFDEASAKWLMQLLQKEFG